jgi:hypothetical protein
MGDHRMVMPQGVATLAANDLVTIGLGALLA